MSIKLSYSSDIPVNYTNVNSGLCYNVLLCVILLSGCITKSDHQTAHRQEGCHNFISSYGAIIRGDSGCRQIALVFTADSFGDGGDVILQTLEERDIRASFFLTGNFYRNSDFRQLIRELKKRNHYLGAHSDRHLLYCSWNNRDSLLVSRDSFALDLLNNYTGMSRFGISKEDAPFYLPPFEWYNDSISAWTEEMGMHLVNNTPGTMSHTDYTTPVMSAYRSSQEIYSDILDFEQINPTGLNGFILLLHLGTDPARKDKLYHRLDDLVSYLINQGYSFVRIDELL